MRTWLKRSVCTAVPLLAVGLALAGCGPEGGQHGADASASPSMSRDEKRVAFTECMREHGVDMSDPDGEGGAGLRLDEGTDQSDVDEAVQACEEYRVGGDAGAGADPADTEKRTEYAECMRENGVEKFPDPAPESGEGAREADEDVVNDPDLDQAVEECRSLLSGTAGGGE
ncbi:hypothetical protein [Streptomonospora salina]|uniref:Secreted protein n=1 Tax=Streptomonospora salina TaxID=104205 RepID=A0A841EB77_9ACTN|nr:hypothetical protein [Streptomonospora salina]MBB5997750.1 hypothetical protein [Streptomonospora salina]